MEAVAKPVFWTRISRIHIAAADRRRKSCSLCETNRLNWRIGDDERHFPEARFRTRRSRQLLVQMRSHGATRTNDHSNHSFQSFKSQTFHEIDSKSLTSPFVALTKRELLLSLGFLTSESLLHTPAHAFLDQDQQLTSSVQGRKVIITGGNSGIGKAAAVELARQGMDVVLACRSRARGDAAAAEITEITGNPNVRAMLCDLASFNSVEQFANDYIRTGRPLHVLVNNAGVMACPKSYTEDGFELQFGVNHLGHFLLTSLLMDNLVKTGMDSPQQKSRVVVVASRAEQLGALDLNDISFDNGRNYNRWVAYGQSKLANILFTRELSRRLEAKGLPVTVNSLHPGVVDTQLIRYVLPENMMEARAAAGSGASKLVKLLGLKTPEEGAATVVYLASSPEVEGRTGGFYEDLKLQKPSSRALDGALAMELWALSETLVSSRGLKVADLFPSAVAL